MPTPTIRKFARKSLGVGYNRLDSGEIEGVVFWHVRDLCRLLWLESESQPAAQMLVIGALMKCSIDLMHFNHF